MTDESMLLVGLDSGDVFISAATKAGTEIFAQDGDASSYTFGLTHASHKKELYIVNLTRDYQINPRECTIF